MGTEMFISIGTVREVENTYSTDGYDGLRIRAELFTDRARNINDVPWAFPLLPKTIQTLPKVGEAVFVINDGTPKSQRYFIGPIISQPQYSTYCKKDDATSLLVGHTANPIEKISNVAETTGAFPNADDVALVGRGSEDVILRYNDNTKSSEIDLRAGIRGEPTNSSNPNLIGNVIFNNNDPAYIQLKYKQGIAKKADTSANSIINMVANRINIMSNKDDNIAHNLGDQNALIPDEKVDEVMGHLHQVPLGDELVKLLKIMKGCILHHVHPWAGMEQCGDWSGYINELNKYDIDSILSKYVRIS